MITFKQLADKLNTTKNRVAYQVRNIISNMKADDDIIPQLEKEFRYNYERVIDTVREWVGIDIDSLPKK